ncbi:hypothetical protein LINPERHAP1_LOCUS20793 [Linum perenne]
MVYENSIPAKFLAWKVKSLHNAGLFL